MTTQRTWLITGSSRGLGRAFAEAALARGDGVAGIARSGSGLAASDDRLLELSADVTDRSSVFDAVAAAFDWAGSIDVVVNNAGTLSLGMIEEFSEAEARAIMETNFFGALWVSQAVMPYLRAQRSGHVVQVSSIAALGGHPATGLYSASKFALEGMSEALAAEAAPFGIDLTILEPGGYWTSLYDSMHMAEPSDAYADLRRQMQEQWQEGSVDSEPRLAAEALMKLVDSDDPPLRLLLGSMIYDLAIDVSRQKMETWAAWESVSRAAEHAVPAPAS